jgi:hypothetical protein
MEAYFAAEKGDTDMMDTLDDVERAIKRMRQDRGRTTLE